MSGRARPSASRAPTGTVGRISGNRPLLSASACGLVLVLGHPGAAYFVFLAYMARPAGPWDSETVAHSGFAAGLALVLSAVMAALTWPCVRFAWLRGWWYTLPAVLAVAALLRLTLLAPHL
ncbi:hypothetical protein OG432_22985 [Streptomyces sp. NBC_00442]|uniref:hypothetical protein n=1 Tax=Streptomyces sp. NBC_00442 TaxID=2903651 RepID=UPI002E2520A2